MIPPDIEKAAKANQKFSMMADLHLTAIDQHF